jgi:hypothetical protein
MSQLSMTYGHGEAGRALWQLELDWARRAVSAIGAKDVCWELGITAPELTDALAERSRGGKDDDEDDDKPKKKSKRRLPGEWIAVIRAMAPTGLQLEWLQIVSRPLGHEPKRVEVKTPAEKLRERDEWLARKSPALLELMARELGH